MKQSITLAEVIKIITKNLGLIIGLGIVCGILLGGYAKIKQNTMYTAKREMVIGHDLDKTIGKDKNSRLLADMQMLPTYSKISKDQAVLSEAKRTLKKDSKTKTTIDSLDSMLKIDEVPRTLILSVSAESNSKKKAVLVANAESKAIKKMLPSLVNNPGNIKLLSPAVKSDVKTKTGPSLKKFGLLGVSVGVFVGLIYVFGRYTFLELGKDRENEN